ncbi:MAG: hypothetical protein J6A61_00875 [Clostridia bacterium]|nr:hypothetical protein [Clostridia bacterium]
MKKMLKSEWVLCIFSLPVIWFLFSRLGTFLTDVTGRELLICYRWIGMVLSELLIVLFRKPISRYLQNGMSKKAGSSIFLVSFLLAILLKPVFLRGCTADGDWICLVGAALLFGGFLTVLFRNFRYMSGRLKTISITKDDLIFASVVLIVINLAAVCYCSFLRKIFTWDNAGYFTSVHQFDQLFPGLSYWKTVYQSVFTTDYNYVIMIPASLFCKLFGKSRLVFVLSIINCYIYPILMLIYGCGKRYFQLNHWKIIFVYLCLPYLLFAANTGFIDVGGIVPVLLALVLYYFGRGEKHAILIGVLLAFGVYLRRWYSFFALSFVITVFFHSLTKKHLKAFFEILGSFSFVLLFFTQDFVSTKLMADYRQIYSAYQLGIRTDVMIFTRYFGVVMTIAVCAYVIAKQIRCHKKLQPETFVLLQTILMFSLFVGVQTHGQQHLSLYIPAFSVLLLSLMKQVNQRFAIVTVAALSAIQTGNTFIPRVQPTSIQGIKHAAVFPNYSAYPPVDENVGSILEITEYMDKEIGEKGKTVCFLASSLNLNFETLNNAEISVSVKKPSDIDRTSYYYSISDVDKRDGFSENLLKTDYILVPSALQIHLAQEEQRVISVPYYEIIEKSGIGTAYEKEEVTFPLADGTEIYLYRKTREITPEEIEALRERIFSPVPIN